MDMQQYWDKVKKVAQDLPENVTLISVETANHKAGNVVVMDRMGAARRIVERTHQIATPEEIKADQEKTEARLAKDRERELRRQPVTRLIPVTQEFGPPAQQARGSKSAV